MWPFATAKSMSSALMDQRIRPQQFNGNMAFPYFLIQPSKITSSASITQLPGTASRTGYLASSKQIISASMHWADMALYSWVIYAWRWQLGPLENSVIGNSAQQFTNLAFFLLLLGFGNSHQINLASSRPLGLLQKLAIRPWQNCEIRPSGTLTDLALQNDKFGLRNKGTRPSNSMN